MSAGQKEKTVKTRAHRVNRDNFKLLMKQTDAKLEAEGVGASMVAISEDDENKIIRFLYKNKVFGYPNSTGAGCVFRFYLLSKKLLILFTSKPRKHRLHRLELLVFLQKKPPFFFDVIGP